MMEWITLISTTGFVTNAILLLIVILFIIGFAIESLKPKSTITWIDLITDSYGHTKKVNMTKMGQLFGIVVSTWLVISLSQNKDAYSIFPLIFPVWLTFIGGIRAYSKWMRTKSPSFGNEQQTNQQTNQQNEVTASKVS